MTARNRTQTCLVRAGAAAAVAVAVPLATFNRFDIDEIEVAGARVAGVDVRGAALVYDPRRLGNDHGLLASHGPHHAEVVAALAPVIVDWFV